MDSKYTYLQQKITSKTSCGMSQTFHPKHSTTRDTRWKRPLSNPQEHVCVCVLAQNAWWESNWIHFFWPSFCLLKSEDEKKSEETFTGLHTGYLEKNIFLDTDLKMLKIDIGIDLANGISVVKYIIVHSWYWQVEKRQVIAPATPNGKKGRALSYKMFSVKNFFHGFWFFRIFFSILTFRMSCGFGKIKLHKNLMRLVGEYSKNRNLFNNRFRPSNLYRILGNKRRPLL